ncbi:hypothetical protein PspLS_11385, partial [Pyricularia sp. CBS 133598]
MGLGAEQGVQGVDHRRRHSLSLHFALSWIWPSAGVRQQRSTTNRRDRLVCYLNGHLPDSVRAGGHPSAEKDFPRSGRRADKGWHTFRVTRPASTTKSSRIPVGSCLDDEAEGDPGELHDTAESEPELLDKMIKHWGTYYAETELYDPGVTFGFTKLLPQLPLVASPPPRRRHPQPHADVGGHAPQQDAHAPALLGLVGPARQAVVRHDAQRDPVLWRADGPLLVLVLVPLNRSSSSGGRAGQHGQTDAKHAAPHGPGAAVALVEPDVADVAAADGQAAAGDVEGGARDDVAGRAVQDKVDQWVGYDKVPHVEPGRHERGGLAHEASVRVSHLSLDVFGEGFDRCDALLFAFVKVAHENVDVFYPPVLGMVFRVERLHRVGHHASPGYF